MWGFSGGVRIGVQSLDLQQTSWYSYVVQLLEGSLQVTCLSPPSASVVLAVVTPGIEPVTSCTNFKTLTT